MRRMSRALRRCSCPLAVALAIAAAHAGPEPRASFDAASAGRVARWVVYANPEEALEAVGTRE